MTQFFEQSQIVSVSRISANGWWIENTTEHVTKGCALGRDFTTHVYQPSAVGLIARYDRETNQWSNEIDNMTLKIYFNKHGQAFTLTEPDSAYPEWAILDAPPEYDASLSTVLYDNGAWAINEVLLGKSYFDANANELKVSDYNFTLPDNHTFEAPPTLTDESCALTLIDGEWTQLLDNRGKMAYAKDRDNSENYLITELGELPKTHTLTEPEPYDSWIDEQWQYDIERHRPIKVAEERVWRNTVLDSVLNRIDQYEKDQSYPEALRTSTLTEAQLLLLLQDRKWLCDYPEQTDFPFSARPKLSDVAL
jgi:hypothetical protein